MRQLNTLNTLALLILTFSNVRAADPSSFCFETPNPPGSPSATGDNTLSCSPGTMTAKDYFDAMVKANISVSTDGNDDCADLLISELSFGNASSQNCTLFWHSVNPPYQPVVDYLNKTVPQQSALPLGGSKSSAVSPGLIVLYSLLALAAVGFVCLLCRGRGEAAGAPLLGGGRTGLDFACPSSGCWPGVVF